MADLGATIKSLSASAGLGTEWALRAIILMVSGSLIGCLMGKHVSLAGYGKANRYVYPTCQMVLAAALAFITSARGDVAWEDLASFYRYSPPAEGRVVEEPYPDSDYYGVKVYIPGANGVYTRGVFLRPRAPGKYPLVLLLHGLAGSKENAVRSMGRQLLSAGCAVFALDAPHHGENRNKDGDAILRAMYARIDTFEKRRDLIEEADASDPTHPFEAFLSSLMHLGVQNYRLSLDYLSRRSDVDTKRIHLLGTSMGAMMGAILGAVDNRVQSLCLVVGGDPLITHIDPARPESRDRLLPVSSSLYISKVAGRPILMINALSDETIPMSATLRLYEAASMPKEIRWYPGGHALNLQAHKDALDWVLKQARR